MEELWSWLEAIPIVAYIAESWWFPLLESIHVIGATFLLGSILMLDLRLIGLASRMHRVSRLSAEIVPWTLTAAVVSFCTGLPLFSTRASHYAHNTAFQIKIVLLVLAAANMLWFHFGTSRNIAHWDREIRPKGGALFAGACSLVCGLE